MTWKFFVTVYKMKNIYTEKPYRILPKDRRQAKNSKSELFYEFFSSLMYGKNEIFIWWNQTKSWKRRVPIRVAVRLNYDRKSEHATRYPWLVENEDFPFARLYSDIIPDTDAHFGDFTFFNPLIIRLAPR